MVMGNRAAILGALMLTLVAAPALGQNVKTEKNGEAEVRYSDFQKKSYDTPDGRVKAGWNQTTATVGISYKF